MLRPVVILLVLQAAVLSALAETAPAMPTGRSTPPLSGAPARAPLVPPPGGLPTRPGAPGAVASVNSAPPREVPLVEKKLEQLSNRDFSGDGTKALSVVPEKWKHAETENFILHYRRATEAVKVAREVEYDLWYVATTLGAGKDRYQKKSHVYVFEDTEEWKQFLSLINSAPKWSASFAFGDELFLNVRGSGNSGGGTSFDSHTLAHETTHAVVARLYSRQRWPIWLNEGFAEYMGGASIAARKGQSGKRFERNLKNAEMSLDTLANFEEYPTRQEEISQLYQTSERFVRFLMTELPKDRIVKYIETVVGGTGLKLALLEVYGDKFKDWDSFTKRFDRFGK